MSRRQSPLAGIWKPRIKQPCMAWVEKNCWLSERFTNVPGFYSATMTPYLRPLHDWFGDDETRSMVSPKGAQIGYTTFVGNAMTYAICQEPGPVIYITSTEPNARAWSQREWLPRIDDCAELKRLKPSSGDAIRILQQDFLPCTVKLAGAQSDTNIKSVPIRYFFADEIDTWPAGFLGQAEARTISFNGTEKRVKGSTCTSEDGPVWLEWIKSTQHMWHVFCPNCKAAQVVDFFKHIKWDSSHRDKLGKWNIEGAKASAYGECQECSARWDLKHQRKIVQGGEARLTNEYASIKDKGLHLPSLLSPYLSWGEIAALWLQKKDEPGGRADFYNQYLGLPFSHDEARVSDAQLLAMRRDDYTLGEIPSQKIVALVFAADPGEKQTHWSVYAFEGDGTSYMVDYGTVLSVEDLLPTLLRLEYPIKGTKVKVKPTVGLIDSGWSTERVYKLCQRSGGRLSPSKGSPAQWGRGITTSSLPSFPGVVLYQYIDFSAKSELYLEKIGRQSEPRMYWPANVGSDWIEGHANQELRSKQTPRGVMKFWKPLPNDHYSDTTKLAMCIWEVLRPRLGVT